QNSFPVGFNIGFQIPGLLRNQPPGLGMINEYFIYPFIRVRLHILLHFPYLETQVYLSNAAGATKQATCYCFNNSSVKWVPLYIDFARHWPGNAAVESAGYPSL